MWQAYTLGQAENARLQPPANFSGIWRHWVTRSDAVRPLHARYTDPLLSYIENSFVEGADYVCIEECIFNDQVQWTKMYHSSGVLVVELTSNGFVRVGWGKSQTRYVGKQVFKSDEPCAIHRGSIYDPIEHLDLRPQYAKEIAKFDAELANSDEGNDLKP
jgi:hypothetical protein